MNRKSSSGDISRTRLKYLDDYLYREIALDRLEHEGYLSPKYRSLLLKQVKECDRGIKRRVK